MDKKITINSLSGHTIAGVLHPGSSKNTVFILCHGFGGSKDDFYSRRIAAGPQKEKISAFRFDYSGNGESTGDSPFHLKNQILDTNSVVSFFAPKYQNIILIGGSMGGLVSTLASMQNTSIKKLVLINPFLYLNERVNFENRIKLAAARLAALFNPQVVAMLKSYANLFKPSRLNIPVYILSSKNDKIVSHKHSQRFYDELGCDKTLQWYNDMDHAVTKQKYVNRVVSYILDWIRT